MVRTRVKGIGMKAASSPATEPDFYSYEASPPEGSPRTDTENGSMSSDMSHTQENTIPEVKSMPNIVSPPGSPVASSSIVKTSQKNMPVCPLDDSSMKVEPAPHTGDEVFFEGLKFIYLDHLDLDDVVNEIAVANVEYL